MSAPELLVIAEARIDAEGLELPVVLATPDPEIESWLLAGFVAESEEERERVEKERERLGFDPCRQAHRLRGDRRRGTAGRDVKKILGLLTGEDHERQGRCWRSPPLDALAERGDASGLATFLREVEERLLPVLTRGR